MHQVEHEHEQRDGDDRHRHEHEQEGHFEWEALNQPDQFEVFYEGVLIFDTGLVGDNINEGTGSATVDVPAGTATSVMVRVTGDESGTPWDYKVNCPVVS